jgi:hypothetical protein
VRHEAEDSPDWQTDSDNESSGSEGENHEHFDLIPDAHVWLAAAWAANQEVDTDED